MMLSEDEKKYDYTTQLVLILVLVDDALWVLIMEDLWSDIFVLILVLVDDALWERRVRSNPRNPSLNPCFSGWCSLRGKKIVRFSKYDPRS